MWAVAGVYAIVHVVSGRRYIGSSKNIKERMSVHAKDLRTGKHHNGHLQRFFDSDGPSSLIATIIETCDKEEIFSREQQWLDLERQPLNTRSKVIYLPGPIPISIERRQEIGRRNAALWTDPVKRQDLLNARSPQTPERRLQVSETFKKAWADPSYRDKMSKRKGHTQPHREGE